VLENFKHRLMVKSDLTCPRHEAEFDAVAGPLALTLLGVTIAYEAYSD
jgi:hypothetical protein